jgi:hypothetical protein
MQSASVVQQAAGLCFVHAEDSATVAANGIQQRQLIPNTIQH